MKSLTPTAQQTKELVLTLQSEIRRAKQGTNDLAEINKSLRQEIRDRDVEYLELSKDYQILGKQYKELESLYLKKQEQPSSTTQEYKLFSILSRLWKLLKR
jgi:hypothetical protein